MTARDILELDEAEFEARIESVKRRMPQPPGLRLQPYVRDFSDTVPADISDRVDSGCGPLNEDHRDQRRSMEGLVIALVLGVAILGTVAIIHFAARWIA